MSYNGWLKPLNLLWGHAVRLHFGKQIACITFHNLYQMLLFFKARKVVYGRESLHHIFDALKP